MFKVNATTINHVSILSTLLYLSIDDYPRYTYLYTKRHSIIRIMRHHTTDEVALPLQDKRHDI